MVEEKWGRTKKTGVNRIISGGIGRVGVVGTNGGIDNIAVKAVINALETVLIGVDAGAAIDSISLRASRTPAIFKLKQTKTLEAAIGTAIHAVAVAFLINHPHVPEAPEGIGNYGEVEVGRRISVEGGGREGNEGFGGTRGADIRHGWDEQVLDVV